MRVNAGYINSTRGKSSNIVQELCESRGGRPGLSVLTSLLVSVDVKLYWTMLRHWSQLIPNYVNWHLRTLSNTTYLPTSSMFLKALRRSMQTNRHGPCNIVQIKAVLLLFLIDGLNPFIFYFHHIKHTSNNGKINKYIHTYMYMPYSDY